MWLVVKLLIVLLILLASGYITLIERKSLALTQIRLRVNKATLAGLLQPLLDAGKLMSKEYLLPLKSYSFWFYTRPLLLYCLALFLWEVPNPHYSLTSLITVVLLLLLLSLKSISALLVGWYSGSKLSSLGALRDIVVSVSFEVVFSLLLFGVALLLWGLQVDRSHLPLLWVAFPFWCTLVLLDTLRTPFDLAEAESELVSGTTTEHRSLTFIFCFLSEYAVILLLSVLTRALFFKTRLVCVVGVILFILVARATYCRVKSDWVMGLTWKKLLPFSVFFVSLLLLLTLASP